MMIIRSYITAAFAATLSAAVLIGSPGCAVSRDQESVGAYIDDTVITSQIKSRFVGNDAVDASSIHIETLNGVVLLSGFAKNSLERTTAESITRKVEGVKGVRNEVTIRP